jgi:hypothetical protein
LREIRIDLVAWHFRERKFVRLLLHTSSATNRLALVYYCCKNSANNARTAVYDYRLTNDAGGGIGAQEVRNCGDLFKCHKTGDGRASRRFCEPGISVW